jgi:microcin C transport system substrate-binding protein
MMLTPFTRRAFIKCAVGSAFALPVATRISLAANPVETELHGLSSFGVLKYPPGFDHFEFAAPDAPQGGTFAFSPSNWAFNQNVQTFNTLNSFVLRGEAPPRMEYCFDSLMAWAWDESDALYCALARSVSISTDRNRYRFRLRDEAYFHDGSPITANDVAFSFNLLKEKGHPQLALDMVNMERAQALDDYTVDIIFNGKQSDRAILSIAAGTPIFSQHYYQSHDFEDSTLQPPLSSGPWRVGQFDTGRYIEYERNRDYWGRDLNFSRGLDHFDRLRIDVFRDRQAAFEAFKKGLVTWREEFTAKVWATEYDFPAVLNGKVRQVYFDSEKNPSMQGWAVNTRKAKFADSRTRQAIGILFDFEWTNRNLFHDAYKRTHSFFENSDFAATGKPSAAELELLEPLSIRLNDAVFDEAIMQNTTTGTGRDRNILREANRLLSEAGWKRDDGRLINDSGEILDIEFLIRSPTFERILGPYTENLRALGIDATIRLVDASQFQSRLETFDFDMVGLAFSFEANPTGEAMRRYFHSDFANRNGAENYPGIADPAIDTLVEHVRTVQTREELIVALRALDRVLRAGYYWIPNWHSPRHRVAMWDMFGWKEPKPDYAFVVERMWWYDEAKAAAISKG